VDGITPERIAGNFYAALFHDLPECVTRDIIAPVKHYSREIEEAIEAAELDLCNEAVFCSVPPEWRGDMKYLLGKDCGADINEFSDRPGINGPLIKACDVIAAFMEAHMSIKYGIASAHLRNGLASTKEYFLNPARRDDVCGIDFKNFFLQA
jgi:putative hydrolase of HD superfamily